MAGRDLNRLVDQALADTFRIGYTGRGQNIGPVLQRDIQGTRLQRQRLYQHRAVLFNHRVTTTVRRNNLAGGQRFFRVSVNAVRGSTSDQVLDDLRREIYARQNDYDDADDDEGPLVQDIQINPLYEFDDQAGINFDGDGDDYLEDPDYMIFPRSRRGFFDFRPKSFELHYSLKKLVIRDMPCIYESLFIILAIENKICNRQQWVECSYWAELVMVQFQKETAQFQDMCYKGMVEECLEEFKKNYGIEVSLFDCYMPEEFVAGDSKYALCYQYEHVFPIEVEQAEELTREITNSRSKTDISHKAFAVYPSYLYTLSLEYRLWKQLGCPERPLEIQVSENNFKYYNWNGVKRIQEGHISLQQILVCQEYHYMSKTQAGQLKIKNALNDESEGTLDQQFEQYLAADPKHKFKIKPETYMRQWERCQFLYDHNGDDVRTVQDRRNAQFSKIGLLGIDIETCEDNRPQELSGTVYNQKPYMLAAYGRLQQVQTHPKYGPVTRLVNNIQEVFMGMGEEDCISQFIDWLVKNNYVWTSIDATRSFRKEHDHGYKQPKIFNYIVAHNGFNFDYRFMYERLLQIGSEFKMIGDISQTKSIQGCGLFLYDFALIYKERLGDLAKTFFPDNKDLWKMDNDNVVALKYTKVESWFGMKESGNVDIFQTTELEDMMRYNMRDAEIVYNLSEKFFRWTFTTPFGHSFLPNMFYHSLSSLAWAMWEKCFFRDVMFVNPITLPTELQMKIGGLTQTYRRKTGCGIIIDVNSFYPSIMMNLMPLHYMDDGDQSIREYREDINESNVDEINTVWMYQIKYKFPADCKLPTIVEKTGDTLVLVLQSQEWKEDMDSDNGSGSIWVFGETIKVAVQYGKAVVRTFKCIRMRGGYVHKDFIDYCYTKRLEAKAAKNTIEDKFYKNMMNMCFGKHGQRQYDQTVFGSWTHLSDYWYQLSQQHGIQKMEMCKSLSNSVPIYELKYSRIGESYNHKGATVRISSFIMEMARTQLMRMKHIIASKIGWESISYCDTDSIVISFDYSDRKLDSTINNMYLRCLPIMKKKERSAEEEILIADYARKSYELIQKSPSYREIQNILVQDVTRLHEKAELPLLDENRLGACKVEKFLLGGLFTGQKQYAMVYTDGKTVKASIKAKGVPASSRSFDLINDIAFDDDCEKISPVIVNTFARMGAGVTIYDKLMLLRATLSKRNHSLIQNISVPFKDIQDQQSFQKEYNLKMEIKRNHFIQTNADLMKIYKEENERYQAFKECLKFKHADNRDFKHALDQLTLMRKKQMIKVPKFKYGFIQDMVLQSFVSDGTLRDYFTAYVTKLYSIASKAVWQYRIQKKKGVNALDSADYYGEARRHTLTDEQCARVICFTLYSNFIAQRLASTKEKFHRTPLFVNICKSLSNIVQTYLGDNEDDKGSMQWHTSIVSAFQFLICPIQVEGIKEYDYSMGDMPITSLWRFFSNVLANQVVNPEYENEDMMMGPVRRLQVVDIGKFDLLFETIKPIANERKPSYGINNMDDEEINTSAIARYAISYTRPTAQSGAIIEEVAEMREKRVMEILINGNIVDAMNADPHYYQKFYDMVFSLDTIKSKLTSDQENYIKLFFERQPRNGGEAKRQDIADFSLIFFIYYHFGIKARELINRMTSEYKSMSGSKADNTVTLVQMMRVIFMRSDMFKRMALSKGNRMNEKISKPVNALLAAVQVAENDQQIKTQVEAIVNDRNLIAPELGLMIDKMLKSQQEDQLFNQAEQYIARALMWLHPDSEDIKTLMAIIKVDSIIKIDSVQFEEVKQVMFEGFDQQIDQYIMSKKQLPFTYDYPFSEVGTPKKNFLEEQLDGFIVPDEEQFVPPDFNEIDFELERDQFNREVGILKRYSQFDLEDDEELIRQADRRQGRTFKRMRLFADMEAEEGEESERGSLLFDA